MSKVTAPLLSLSASGTFGKTLTSRVWKGKNVMALKSNPSNPQTTGQMAARAIFASIGKVTKRADLTETVVAWLKQYAPAGQTWGSYFGRLYSGTGNAHFEAAKTAYNTVGNATVKGYFDDAASQAGIEAVNLDGTSNTQVAAGLALWCAYDALYLAGEPDAPAATAGATEAQVFAFTDALTGVLPS